MKNNIDLKINRELSPLENGLSHLFLKKGWLTTKSLPNDYDCLDLRGKVANIDGEKKAEILVDAHVKPKIDVRYFKMGLYPVIENYFKDGLQDYIDDLPVNDWLDGYGREYPGKDGSGKLRHQVARFYQEHGEMIVERIVKLESNLRTAQAVFLERWPEYTESQKLDSEKLLVDFLREWDRNVSVDDVELGLEERRRMKELNRANKLIGYLRWQIDTQFADEIDQQEAVDVLRSLRLETGLNRVSRQRQEWLRRMNDLMYEISLVGFEMTKERQLMIGDYLRNEQAQIHAIIDELTIRKQANCAMNSICQYWSEIYLKIYWGDLASVDRDRLSDLLEVRVHQLSKEEVLELISERLRVQGNELSQTCDWERGVAGGELSEMSLIEIENYFYETRLEVQNKLRLSCDVRQALNGLSDDNLYRIEMERLWRNEGIRDLDAHVLRDYVRDEVNRIYFGIMQALIQDCQVSYVDRVFNDQEIFNQWRDQAIAVDYGQRRLRLRLMNSFKNLALKVCVDLADRELEMPKRLYLRNLVNRYEEYKKISRIFT